MTMPVRIILMIFGWLIWSFWMVMAFHSGFIGMLSKNEEDEYFCFRFIFKPLFIRKTRRNKVLILIGFILFGMAVIAALCLLTQ